MTFGKERISNQLKNMTATVTFEKADGTTRVMNCTLMPEYLPAAKPLDENVRHVPRKENPNVLAVWDIDNGGWRSFNIDSIIQIEYNMGELNAASA